LINFFKNLFSKGSHKNKLFTIVREDIPPGYQLAQTLHAGIDLVLSKNHNTTASDWKLNSNTVICLSVTDEESLKIVYLEAVRLGHNPVIFTEPDIGDQFTSFAFISHSEAGRQLEISTGQKINLALLRYWNL
jgi:hypothetical protein